jgi:hypothetical protein
MHVLERKGGITNEALAGFVLVFLAGNSSFDFRIRRNEKWRGLPTGPILPVGNSLLPFQDMH